MLFFLPPVVQILGGILILVVGVTMHSVIVGVVGGLALVIGGGRWLRKRRDGAAQ
ncbi:MAG: hypothetical protein ACRDN0_30840 [Trebonia sp.]